MGECFFDSSFIKVMYLKDVATQIKNNMSYGIHEVIWRNGENEA